ncbi:enoyl-ACP reductase FabI [Candidatus Protofrankia californiensis]|uniref:enoyl-ACP reductase FabI n=1 Tax=Candidatus Protofrankia californiensis TaxID=1839754 RepID=UPI0019CFDEB3|nr:SDR family oxidoreductase [Candidatus Protofrankia californiensis]
MGLLVGYRSEVDRRRRLVGSSSGHRELTVLVPLKDSWSLVFGVSSGMGQATARALAAEGGNVIGVHFDTSEGREAAEKLAAELHERGVAAHFFNRNVAASATRADLIPRIAELTGGAGLRVVLHSVAFGSLLPFVPTAEATGTITAKQMAMTLDVMAHSLVYWTQDLLAAGLLRPGAKIYALTSAGSSLVIPNYGAVSAAKSALESHVRQLAVELAQRGVAVNALRPGTTITPAFRKIPGSTQFDDKCLARNPHRRLTRPEDVGEAIVMLSASDSSWVTGNVIGVDGGELIGT